MLVEIHMIQNHAPSNLNRDDTGSPKSADFGRTLRARISSQCIKRSIRQSPIFQAAMKNHLGSRTRRLPERLKETLTEMGCPDEEVSVIVKKSSGFGSDKEMEAAVGERQETRQLIFLGEEEVPRLVQALRAKYAEMGKAGFEKMKAEELAKAVGSSLPRSADIALFGRMTTSAAFEDVEAAMQVAHALGTTKLDHQFDYFTAVDDLIQESDEIGAGMIGDVEFNSATYYKYFSLDWDEFLKNLGGDRETARAALGAFLKAAALTTPTGKQNSFAAHNPPDAIFLEAKDQKIPVSYANAFLKPVRSAADKDVIETSIEMLREYVTQIKAAYGLSAAASIWLCPRGKDGPDGSEKAKTLEDLISRTLATLDDGEGGSES